MNDSEAGMSPTQKLVLLLVAGVVAGTVCLCLYLDEMLYEQRIEQAGLNARKIATATSHLVGRFAPVENAGALSPDDAYGGLREAVDRLAGKLEDVQITVIASNGVVVADSRVAVAALAALDSHADRPEVLAARKLGAGSAVRVSDTTGITYLYAAVTDRRGSEYLSRVAVPMTHLLADQRRTRQLLFGGSGTFILAIVGLAVLLHRKIGIAAGLTLDRAELESVVAARTATLTELQDLGGMLAICNDLDDACKVVAAHVPRLIECSGGALSLINSSRNLLEIRHSWGESWPRAEYAALGDCWALRRSAVHNSSRDGGILCRHLTSDLEHDLICIPLIAQGETLGVIHLIAPGAPATETSLTDARTVGEEVAVAILNLQLREALKHQALRDPLTKLYNRRFLEEHFAYETARCTRHGKSMSLAVIDVDHFKRFNDTFGHDAGDYVLSQIATHLQKSCRGEDVICRLGGEEFAVVLAETDRVDALQSGEKLRKVVERLELVFGGKALGNLSISIGVASFPDDGLDLAGLLKAADDALYRAKKTGRNRVVGAWTRDADDEEQPAREGDVLQAGAG